MDSAGVAKDLWRRGTSGDVEDVGSRGRTKVFVGGDVVLKVFLGDTDKPDREVAGLRAAASSGLRVPELLWHGHVDGRRSVLVERLTGTQPVPSTDDEWRSLSEATGAVARHLHLAVPAFGSWTVAPHTAVGALVRERAAEHVRTVLDQGVLDAAVVDTLHRWLERRSSPLDSEAPVLVHRDLSDRNVFGTRSASGWELTAVIDFESSGGGVPEEEARWPALLQLGGLRPRGTTEAFERGLGVELRRDVLDIFVVDAAIDVMSYAGHRNPALMDAAIAAAHATVG